MVRFVTMMVMLLVGIDAGIAAGMGPGMGAAMGAGIDARVDAAWPVQETPVQDRSAQDSVPERAPQSAPTSGRARSKTSASALNLNTASAAELAELPGIGVATAARIVEYRQKQGPFKRIEDLMQVRGIGEKSFLKLKPLITVTPLKADRGTGAAQG